MALNVEAAIYETVDEHGNKVFTDDGKNKNSKEVQLKPVTPVPAPKIVTQPPLYSSPINNSVSYSILRIVQPENGASIRGEGNFEVQVSMSPRLAPGHQTQLFVNGKSLGPPARRLFFKVTNADRGENVLVIKVVDSKGKVVSAANSKVFVHRPIVRSVGG